MCSVERWVVSLDDAETFDFGGAFIPAYEGRLESEGWKAVDMGSANPAAAFGVRKGRIEVGYDADLAIFDFRNVTTVDVRKLHSKAGHTPYHGREAVFPEMVLIRGQIQVKDREFCGDHIGEDICDRL